MPKQGKPAWLDYSSKFGLLWMAAENWKCLYFVWQSLWTILQLIITFWSACTSSYCCPPLESDRFCVLGWCAVCQCQRGRIGQYRYRCLYCRSARPVTVGEREQYTTSEVFFSLRTTPLMWRTLPFTVSHICAWLPVSWHSKQFHQNNQPRCRNLGYLKTW